MKNVFTGIIAGVLFFAVMSCGLIDRFTSIGEKMNKVPDLWSDVPRMDGLAPSEMELPLTVKLFMRTALNNLWRLNKEGEDKTPVQGDWIVFTTSGPPTDVRNFYTIERMTSFGNWEASKESTCLDGKDKGIDGVLCVFQKFADKKDILLAIIAMKDDESKPTGVFYLRLEKDADTAANSATASNKPNSSTRGPITKLNGSAPYAIEKRPMPTGLDLDQLLPKQVGPYTRVVLEKSEQRGSTPASIQVVGNSVDATYRDGNREIFVEFGVSTKAEDAQSALDVAAADSTDKFPTDPRFGSIGTEPSYLKVVNESGAFFAWTRGGYFITANAKGGESDLDAFMQAFPY
jgi:hypothetical protein